MTDKRTNPLLTLDLPAIPAEPAAIIAVLTRDYSASLPPLRVHDDLLLRLGEPRTAQQSVFFDALEFPRAEDGAYRPGARYKALTFDVTAHGGLCLVRITVRRRAVWYALFYAERIADTFGVDIAALRADYARLADVPLPLGAQQEVKARRKPSEKTRLRAEIFRAIKDERPDFGYDAVAQEAVRRHPELGDGITGETVRNAYRALGWQWERANKIR